MQTKMTPERLFEIEFRGKPDRRLFRLNGNPPKMRWLNWGYYRTRREMNLLLESLPAKFQAYEFRASPNNPEGE